MSSSAIPIPNIFSPGNYYYYFIYHFMAIDFFLLLLCLFFDTKKVHAFFSRFNSRVSPQPDDNSPVAPKPDRIEVGPVLKSLGIMSCGDMSVEADDVFTLFDEKSPSLDEVREAFDVFDDNKDGFIDAEEVQRVLRALGVSRGSSVEDCRRMIGAHDCNHDGVLDFDEFVRFMETVSC